MPELLRFQIARATQRQRGPLPTLAVGDTEMARIWISERAPRSMAKIFLDERGMTPATSRYVAPAELAGTLDLLREIDEFIVAAGNDLSPRILQRYLTGRGETWSSAAGSLAALAEDLSTTVVGVVVAQVSVDLRTDVLRLALVLALVRLFVAPARTADAGDATEGRVATPSSPGPILREPTLPGPILDMLRHRDITLPSALVDACGGPHSQLARPPGVSDLWVARDEWARYEAGEIAHIENVLAGELKSRLLDRTTEQETIETTSTDRTSVIEQDSQTTTRFELAQEAQRDTELAAHVEGQVDTSGQYGPTKVTTHLGGSLDYSAVDSAHAAVKQSKETIQRAVTRVEETVSTRRTARQLVRVREQDKHRLDNSQGDGHVTGIYRWVDKVQRVQLFRYPNRTLFEFEIPEPAAFVRWLAARPVTGVRAVNPPPLTVDGTAQGVALTPSAITATPGDHGCFYEQLAARYYATGMPPPPTGTVVYASVANPDPETDVKTANKAPKYSATTIAIPAGFVGTSFSVYAVATNAVPETANNPTGWYEITIGTDFPSTVPADDDTANIWRFQGKNVFHGLRSTAFRRPVSGSIPVLLATDDSSGGILSIEIRCEPSPTTVLEWQQKVYDAVTSAYWALKDQYADEVAQLSIRAGLTVAGDSPVRNAAVVREELRKLVLEMLMGRRFLGRDALGEIEVGTHDQAVRLPATDFDAAAATASEIQFLEQAFEWENMTYVLYPYYWAGVERWAELCQVKSPDPVFDDFLRCGSARVIVPARPGFECQANAYTLFGELWGGGSTPVPGDDLYLAVAAEIRAQQRPINDGEPGESWEVRLPTTLLYLEPAETTLPLTNDHAQLPAVP